MASKQSVRDVEDWDKQYFPERKLPSLLLLFDELLLLLLFPEGETEIPFPPAKGESARGSNKFSKVCFLVMISLPDVVVTKYQRPDRLLVANLDVLTSGSSSPS